MSSVSAPKSISPQSVQTLPPIPRRFPLELHFQFEQVWARDFYRHKSDPSKVDKLRLKFQRLAAGIHYPFGELPIRGSLAIGGERAEVEFQADNISNNLDINVSVASDPTFFMSKGLEVYLVGKEKHPHLFSSSFLDVMAFTQIDASLFPRRLKDYAIDLEADNIRLDLTSVGKQHIQSADYQLFRWDSGLGLKIYAARWAEPYGYLGYSYLSSSLFMHYRPSGKQFMDTTGISNKDLRRGRFDFEKNLLYAALGTRFPITRIWSLAVEGDRIDIRRTSVAGLRFSSHFLLGDPS